MSDFKCDNSRKLPIHQLNKLDVCDISRYDIFPLSVVQAIFDATSGIRLDSILSAMNFLFIPYAGSDEATRLQIPLKGRHRSLILSYIDYDKNIHIEQYVSDCFRDTAWKCDNNWKCPFTEGTFVLNVGDEKLTELLTPIFNEYKNTDEFIGILTQAVLNWLNTSGETVLRRVINEELDKRKLVYYENIKEYKEYKFYIEFSDGFIGLDVNSNETLIIKPIDYEGAHGVAIDNKTSMTGFRNYGEIALLDYYVNNIHTPFPYNIEFFDANRNSLPYSHNNDKSHINWNPITTTSFIKISNKN